MSSLTERLNQAFKEALKGRQEVALSTLRMLRTAIRHKEVELKRQLTETDIQAVIGTQAFALSVSGSLRREKIQTGWIYGHGEPV